MTRPAPNRREALSLILAGAAGLAASPTPAQEAAPAASPSGAPSSGATASSPDPAIPRLGEELTPLGAVRAGNKTRAIPPWTGGLITAPKGYVPGRHSPDPYVDDGRWFTVGPGDIERYKIRLSAGLQALLRKYPGSFEVPIFPSRRSAAAPESFYQATMANAGRAALGENGLVLRGATVGIPFPIPANGVQAMWNHVLRWRGLSMSRTSLTALPAPDGGLPVTGVREDFLSPYAADRMADTPAGKPLLYRRTQLSPPDSAGSTLVIQSTLNPIQSGFSAWFRQGERGRVVRAPDFDYDTPDPLSGGIRTADMLDMFSGALDRFDFTLVSRREMYVPYNAYRLNNPNLSPTDFLWFGHPNPQFLRYEMHRVWIVDAKIKPAYRHSLPDRTYYLDEDSWQIVMAEHYDAKGQLVRYAEAHGVAHWQVPVFAPAMEFAYDLEGDKYVASGIDNATTPPLFDRPLPSTDFTPEALVRRGRRS